MTATTERIGSSAGLGPDTAQNDLRTFLKAVEARGELATVRGAHWDKELGAVTEVLYRQKVEKSPMLMFDDIPGYAPGYRCTTACSARPTVGARLGGEAASPTIAKRSSITANIKKAYKQIALIVDDDPVCETRARRRHRRRGVPGSGPPRTDGGRHCTACGVIARDPDTGRVSVGTYRVMVKGPRTRPCHPNGARPHSPRQSTKVQTVSVAIIVGIDRSPTSPPRTRWPKWVPEYDGAAA